MALKQFESSVVQVGSGTASVKATIPQFIAQSLDLAAGDTLVWSIEPGALSVSVGKKSEKKSPKRS